ncbi:MAG: serine--tRNA ligase [Thalassobaculales bacterium]
MIDIALIRADAAAFDAALARRGLAPLSAEILDLDQRRRAVQTELQRGQARRNEASKEIGQARKAGGDAAALMAEVAALKEALPRLEDEERQLAGALDAILAGIPNLPSPDVPEGPDESGNVEIRRHGSPRNLEAPKEHFDLGEALGLMDFEAASRLSGARFVVLKGALARLERALASFMLDSHTLGFGYTEVVPPFLVREAAVYGVGQLPKFAEDLFRTTNDYWLIPTAEVPLTSLVMDQIVAEEALPLRFTAYSPCFRSEAGAAGKDTRGMIRQHQFSKVELVSIAHPDHSQAEHERMTEAAETILKKLELPFRTVVLCTGDMGFASRKTYDIEVWLPGQGRYREISSCSNCGDFQARRMKARFRGADRQTRLVHTLNGSGLAIGRTIVAILENWQEPGGAITIPPALRPYMGGLERIEATAA